MAQVSHEGYGNYHGGSGDTMDRRVFLKYVSLGAVSLGGAAALFTGLKQRGGGDSHEAFPLAVGGESEESESGVSFNGHTQSPDLYEGRLNPTDFVDIPETDFAEKMSMRIIDLESDSEIALAHIRNLELYINLGCVPEDAQNAMETAGYSLKNENDETKSVQANFSEYRNDKYGHAIENITDGVYEKYDFSGVTEAIQEFADVTAHNFGNQISIDPGKYGATADVTTYVSLDSVQRIPVNEIPGDRKLEIGVTIRFAGPYKDDILTGIYHLILNEVGDKYQPVITYLDLNQKIS